MFFRELRLRIMSDRRFLEPPARFPISADLRLFVEGRRESQAHFETGISETSDGKVDFGIVKLLGNFEVGVVHAPNLYTVSSQSGRRAAATMQPTFSLSEPDLSTPLCTT
jgi:hypothetical protein